jgi:hypothetical protein
VPVADRGEVTKQSPIAEIGTDQPHVRQVGAADMRIIEDEDVAVVQIAIGSGFFNHRLDRKGHHTDKNRKTGFSLDQRVPGPA